MVLTLKLGVKFSGKAFTSTGGRESRGPPSGEPILAQLYRLRAQEKRVAVASRNDNGKKPLNFINGKCRVLRPSHCPVNLLKVY